MKNKTVPFIVGCAVIFIIAAVILVIAKSYVKNFEVIIIQKEEERSYDNVLLTTYQEYQDFLKEYNALGKFNQSDFNRYDYFVDYIPYIKDMKINDIQIDVKDDGLNITYDIDKDIEDTEKLLVSLIPIKKSSIREIGEVTRDFK